MSYVCETAPLTPVATTNIASLEPQIVSRRKEMRRSRVTPALAWHNVVYAGKSLRPTGAIPTQRMCATTYQGMGCVRKDVPERMASIADDGMELETNVGIRENGCFGIFSSSL